MPNGNHDKENGREIDQKNDSGTIEFSDKDGTFVNYTDKDGHSYTVNVADDPEIMQVYYAKEEALMEGDVEAHEKLENLFDYLVHLLKKDDSISL